MSIERKYQVRTIWIDALLTQSLHHAATLELHLQDRPDVLENPWRLQVQELNQAPRTLPDGTSIVQVYDSADSELLILGEPGAAVVAEGGRRLYFCASAVIGLFCGFGGEG